MDNENDTKSPTAHRPLAPTLMPTTAADVQDAPPTAVGWVGLGDQGAPMARAIAEAGFELHVWVRRPQSLQELHGLPYVVHDTLAQLGEASEAVGLCLRVDSDITDVMIERGLLERLKPESVIVNHGTGLPGFANDLYRRAAERGIEALDAPVSGGRPAAEARTLTTIVGGDADVLARMRPVFSSFSTTIAHMGGAGAGQIGKLINNALLMMNQQNVQLVLTLAGELKLDTQALIDLLLAGTGSSFALQALRGAVTTENAEHLSTLQVIDMDLFDQAVRSWGVVTPRISARAIEGARDLPEAARLASVGRDA
jgi:3-hydroxyisobutyrate dehydrogenase-like beta-hydroxyacid dehydrogenase